MLTSIVGSVFAAKIEVNAGEDIAAALRKATQADTILLKSGTHTLKSKIFANKSIVLMGDPASETTLDFTTIALTTTGKRVVLENLNLVAQRKYLIYNDGENEVDVDEVLFKNCTINLNERIGMCVMLNRSTQAKNKIKSMVFDNCVIFDANNSSHGLINIPKDSSLEIGEIVVTNSTLVDFTRGVILVNKPSADLTVRVENVTLYNVNISENAGGIFHFMGGDVDFQMKNSIYHIPGDSPKLVDVGKQGSASVVNSYRTNEQSRLRNQYQTTSLSKEADDVFKAPGNNPAGGDVDFKIVDKSVKGGSAIVGDGRWNK